MSSNLLNNKEKQKSLAVMNFGVHLMIDGYGGDKDKLNDSKLVYKCLDELPGLIGMRKLGEPVVLLAPPVSEKDSGGYTGFVVINASHVSCHTFPNRRFVSIDVYSCRDEIDQEFIKKYFQDAFSLQDLEVNYVKRGTRFPVRDLL